MPSPEKVELKSLSHLVSAVDAWRGDHTSQKIIDDALKVIEAKSDRFTPEQRMLLNNVKDDWESRVVYFGKNYENIQELNRAIHAEVVLASDKNLNIDWEALKKPQPVPTQAELDIEDIKRQQTEKRMEGWEREFMSHIQEDERHIAEQTPREKTPKPKSERRTAQGTTQRGFTNLAQAERERKEELAKEVEKLRTQEKTQAQEKRQEPTPAPKKDKPE